MVRTITVADPLGVLDWLAPRAIEGIETVEADRYRRTLATPAGPAVASATVDGAFVRITSDHGNDAARSAAITALSRVFAPLGDGAVAGDAAPRTRSASLLSALDPADETIRAAAHAMGFADLVAQIDGGPIAHPGCADPHEMLVRAIIGQQISVTAATGQLRLLAQLGDTIRTDAGSLRLFPTPAVIAAGAAEVLRGPRAKTATVVSAMAAIVEGSLTITANSDTRMLQARLIELRGIGPWTAGYLAIRLGDPDVFLPGDSAIRAGARRLGIADAGELARLAAACAPHRSRLMLRCWRA